MEAYARLVRPLSDAEKSQYLREQAPVGRMGGAEWVPESVEELDDYVERMRPLMAMTEQTREFIDFLAGAADGEYHDSAPNQLRRRLDLAASMRLMPAWARHLSGTYQPWIVDRALPRLEHAPPGRRHPVGRARAAVQADRHGPRPRPAAPGARRIPRRGRLTRHGVEGPEPGRCDAGPSGDAWHLILADAPRSPR